MASILLYSILGQNLIMWLAAMITMFLSTHILFHRKLFTKTKAISPTILIYLGFQLVWSLASIIHCIYAICLWRPDMIIYDQKTLFIIGFPFYILQLLNTTIECCLGLDRCLCIVFPIKYQERLRSAFGLITIATIILFTTALITSNNFIAIFFKDLTTNCPFFGCIILQQRIPYVYYLKLGTIILNGIIGGVLFLLVRYYLPNLSSKNTRKMHRTIIFVIVSTTFFEIVPNVIGSIYSSKTGVNVGISLGPYTSCLISINIAVCSWVYFIALRNGIKRVTYSGIITVMASIDRRK